MRPGEWLMRKLMPIRTEGMFDTETSTATRRELQWYQKLNSYCYMDIAQLAIEGKTLEEGTKIRVQGYPEFVESHIEDTPRRVWNYHYSSHMVHYGGFGGYSHRVNDGRSVEADVRTTTYTLHTTPDLKDNGITIQQSQVASYTSGYLRTHFDAPELKKLDPHQAVMALGQVVRTEDGEVQLKLDDIVPGR